MTYLLYGFVGYLIVAYLWTFILVATGDEQAQKRGLNSQDVAIIFLLGPFIFLWGAIAFVAASARDWWRTDR